MKNAIRRMVSLVILVLLFLGLQQLVIPKYMDGIMEGAFISEYYKEASRHDVIMVGDCELYENFSPIKLWEDYGITSYIRGSAQQLIWQSYYMLEDTLKTEIPKVVIFNVLSMKYGEPQKEEYNRMTIDGMRWSSSKIKNIMASMTKGESFLDYLFPILRFHTRSQYLEESDFRYYVKRRKITHNGYYMRIDVDPLEFEWEEEEPENYQFADITWKYLDKMNALCERNGIRLILVKAPSVSPVWYDEYEQQIRDYAWDKGLLYINFLELTEEIDIDYTVDTYDQGLHMNLSGAEKLSVYLGQVLMEQCGLEDYRNDEILSAIWVDKIKFYEDMKDAQQKELDTYGYLKNF